MQLVTLFLVGVRAITLRSHVAVQSATQLWHLISPEKCFGPDCCVHVGKLEDMCTIETKCEQVASPHRLKNLEYSLICQKGRSWQKHSFGYGGFDLTEHFVTNIQCDSCHAPRLSDYEFAVGMRDDAAHIRHLVQRRVRRHKKLSQQKKVAQRSRQTRAKPNEVEATPEGAPAEGKPDDESLIREGGTKNWKKETDDWMSDATSEELPPMEGGGFCGVGSTAKSACCAPLEQAENIIARAVEREGPCAKIVQIEMAKLVNARGVTKDDPVCFLTTRLASIALNAHRGMCSSACTNELGQLARGLMTKPSLQPQRRGAPVVSPSLAQPRGLLQVSHAVRLALGHVGLQDAVWMRAVEWIWARNNTGETESVHREPQNGVPYGMNMPKRGLRNGLQFGMDMEKASKALSMVCDSKCAVKLMHAALSVTDVIHDMVVTPRFANVFDQWPRQVRLGTQYLKFVHPSIRPTVDAICAKNDDGTLCMASWSLERIKQEDLGTSLAGASMCKTTCGVARANTHMSAKMGFEVMVDKKPEATGGPVSRSPVSRAPFISRDLATYVHLRRFTGTPRGCGQQDAQYCVDFVASQEKRDTNLVEVNTFFSACGDLVTGNLPCDATCRAAIVAFRKLFGCCARLVLVLSKSVKFWETADVMRDPFTEVEKGYESALDTIAMKCGRGKHNLRPCEYAVPTSVRFTLPLPDVADNDARTQVALLVRGCLAKELSTDVSTVTVITGAKDFEAQISTPSARESKRLNEKMSSMRSKSGFSCSEVATHLRDAFPTLAVTLRFASNAPSTKLIEEKLKAVLPKAVRIAVVSPRNNGAASFLIQDASNDAPNVANVLYKDVASLESEATKVTPKQFSDANSSIMQAFQETPLDPASSGSEILTFVDATSLIVDPVHSLGEPFGPDACVYVRRGDDGFCKIVMQDCDVQELRTFENTFTCHAKDGTQKIHSFGHFEDIGSSEVIDTKVACVKCSVTREDAAAMKSDAKQGASLRLALPLALMQCFLWNAP